MRQEVAVKAIVMCYAVSNKGMDMVEMPKICTCDRYVVTIRPCIGTYLRHFVDIFVTVHTFF